MAKLRSTPTRQQFPGIARRVIVDAYRGQLRVRAWPRKRGPGGTPAQLEQRAWFKAANEIAKRCAPSQQTIAIEATRNTGLYPRDLMLRAMSRGIVDIINQDGRVLTQRRPFIEDVMYQGTILRANAPITIGNGVLNAVPWPVPVIDTAGMWDAGNPTRLTIPTGVEVVNFEAGTQLATSGAGRLVAIIQKNGTTVYSRLETETSTLQSGPLATGPVSVTPGDFFELKAKIDVGTQLDGVPSTYFTATILQATT